VSESFFDQGDGGTILDTMGGMRVPEPVGRNIACDSCLARGCSNDAMNLGLIDALGFLARA
jgi:hypothetical protein